MKIILAFCLFTAVAALELSPEEKECQKQVDASEEDVEMFRSLQQPEEHTTKCYYDCMLQRINYSDGKRFNREGFVHTMTQVAKNEQQRKAIQHLAEQCDGTENDDPCELAADIVACLFR
ncbi:general odorant-binding protein 19d-like [Culex pipiens pallens]|uniref:general odorant-binding protein 19d-like n=1 Tax=Culex pipiens pallens TaxID=42434 RepID=UPI001952A35D|nr:general odorant-binding protein 19d-like [Culex pipiens pallens]